MTKHPAAGVGKKRWLGYVHNKKTKKTIKNVRSCALKGRLLPDAPWIVQLSPVLTVDQSHPDITDGKLHLARTPQSDAK
jgi:hypothetical protein